MLQFKPIELTDKPWIDELLALSDFQGCEYNFTNNFVWRNIYGISICRFKDFYIVKSSKGFFFPAGQGNIRELIKELSDYSTKKGEKLRFVTMDKTSKEQLEKEFPGSFVFQTDEDVYDYVYTTESLSTLSGKKLHSKRNYINRFKQLDWSFEQISEDNIDECREMSTLWCKLNNCDMNEEKADEMCSVENGLDNFKALGLEGLILRVNGKIQAFSYGEKLNSDTFVTHVEKALTEYDGTYPMINYLMANEICKGFKYINREEDMGEENLRKAKRSYRPCFMIEKFSADYIG